MRNRYALRRQRFWKLRYGPPGKGCHQSFLYSKTKWRDQRVITELGHRWPTGDEASTPRRKFTPFRRPSLPARQALEPSRLGRPGSLLTMVTASDPPGAAPRPPNFQSFCSQKEAHSTASRTSRQETALYRLLNGPLTSLYLYQLTETFMSEFMSENTYMTRFYIYPSSKDSDMVIWISI